MCHSWSCIPSICNFYNSGVHFPKWDCKINIIILPSSLSSPLPSAAAAAASVSMQERVNNPDPWKCEFQRENHRHPRHHHLTHHFEPHFSCRNRGKHNLKVIRIPVKKALCPFRLPQGCYYGYLCSRHHFEGEKRHSWAAASLSHHRSLH